MGVGTYAYVRRCFTITLDGVHNFVRACLRSRARNPRVGIPPSGAGPARTRGNIYMRAGTSFTAILITRLSSAGKHKFRSAVRSRAHTRIDIHPRGYRLEARNVAQPPVNFVRLSTLETVVLAF